MRDTIVDVMIGLGRPVESDWPSDHPLDLESIEVVMLHDGLEQAFDVRIPAARVTPETFGTLDSLAALIDEVKRS